ncbi:MAG: hypothetical protein SWZ49_33320 [Cyanobacteriota bacterium]|nr:hypothetical protein [Cyanobacteriota bacterium]
MISALAYNTQIPEAERTKYFEQLFAKKANYIPQTIAENPLTPPNIIIQIMSKRGVAQAVAENPNAPVRVLAELAEDENSTTRRLVAENPGTPAEILIQLARQPIEKKVSIGWVIDRNVRDAAFKNPNFPFLERYRLSVETEQDEETKKVHQLMAKRTDSPFALSQVVKNGDRHSKITAARNPKTPISILEQLAKDADEDVRSVLVQNPNLPSNCLIELAKNSTFNVQLTIARRTHPTPIEVLLQFSLHEDKIIRSEIARNKNTPSDVLAFLAEDKERDVKIKALSNKNIPREVLSQALLNIYEQEEIESILRGQKNSRGDSLIPADILERLSKHPHDFIRYLVAAYPTASVKTLERLAFDKDKLIPNVVAENPSTPASLLTELARHNPVTTNNGCYHSIAYKIAIRKDAPPEALDYIARQSVVPVIYVALRNPNTPVNALEWLVENQDNESVLGLVAKHPNNTSDILIKLSANESVKVRQVVASQQQCPVEILKILAEDSAIEVQEKVAANPKTPNQILETFAQSENTAIRKAVASNPNLSQTTLEQLANDEKIEVRRAVAKNSNTPENIRESLRNTVLLPKKQQTSPTLNSLPQIYNSSNDDLSTVLTEYAQSDNEFVRFVVLLHPVIPEEILTQGANSAFWLERYAVAENQATSLEIREKLARDGNWIVRAAANQSLSNSN